MSGHVNANTNKGLGALGYAVYAMCAEMVARARRLPVGTIVFILVALAWIAASGWWTFVRSNYDAGLALRYQAEVARCRELPTSEARYECVSRALIGRDRENFSRAIVVFIPPLVMLFGRYIWREMRASVREREHARLAEERGRRQLAEFHREMVARREALKPAKRADWDADTAWAEEIAQSPRARRAPEPHPPAPAAPEAVKRA
jgi:hypothetical protein